MSTLYLLGAGASVGAGVPASAGMVRELQRLVRLNGREPHLRAFQLVVGGLFYRYGARGLDPFASVDIEDLVRAVQTLADRYTLEAAPFVAAWRPEVEELDLGPAFHMATRDLSESVVSIVERAISAGEEAIKEGFADHPLGRAAAGGGDFGNRADSWMRSVLARWHQKVTARHHENVTSVRNPATRALEAGASRGRGHIYEDLLALIRRLLPRIAWVREVDRVAYLQPLLEIAERRGRLVVATLNFDNTVELIASTKKLPVCRLVEDWSWGAGLKCADSGLSLIKLHGSLDWTLSNAAPLPGNTIPRRRVETLPSDRVIADVGVPAVIFGETNKLTADGPFLDLLSAFRSELSVSSELVAVGYSFRDEHINQNVWQWLAGDTDRRIKVIDPRFQEQQHPWAKRLQGLPAARVTIIRETAENALPNLLSEMT